MLLKECKDLNHKAELFRYSISSNMSFQFVFRGARLIFLLLISIQIFQSYCFPNNHECECDFNLNWFYSGSHGVIVFIPVQLDAEIDEAAIKISKELVQTVDSAFDLVDKLLEVIQIPIIYFLFISTAVNSLD